MLITILRILAFPCAALTYYAAFLMYDDEEGNWQSKIENLWVAIDDRRKLVGGSEASAFFNKVAETATRGFDRVFGRRLVSLQLIGVSSSYSFAGLFLGLGLVFAFLFQSARLVASLPPRDASAILLIKHVCIVIGLICLVLAALPSVVRSSWSVALSLFPITLFVSGLIKTTILAKPTTGATEILVALVASFLSDVVSLALIRFTIRQVSSRPNLSRIAVAITTQAAVASLLVVVPFQAGGFLMGKLGQTPATQALFCLGIFNIFTGIASSVFVLLLLLVLLHRAMWPVLGRLFYSLARHQVIRNRMIMAGAGTACLVFAFPLMPPVLKSFLEWLAK